MNHEQESRKHHYVPVFLMKPWTIDGLLTGYSWDGWKRRLKCTKRGTDGFCYEPDLLALEQHPQGQDVLERKFFGGVDTNGARARDRILEGGPRALSPDERCDLARAILSLEIRLPEFVEYIRGRTTQLVESIDSDAEARQAIELEGTFASPSQWYANQVGYSMQEWSFSNAVQQLVDNPNVGGKMINSRWQLVRLGARDGTFVLADHPVVRDRGLWLLPLNPKSALRICGEGREIWKGSAQRFAKELNKASAAQARKYVFSIDERHERWLGKHLAAKAPRSRHA